jgi:hypothetical protein
MIKFALFAGVGDPRFETVIGLALENSTALIVFPVVSILQVTPRAIDIQNVPQLALDTHFSGNIHSITILYRGAL